MKAKFEIRLIAKNENTGNEHFVDIVAYATIPALPAVGSTMFTHPKGMPCELEHEVTHSDWLLQNGSVMPFICLKTCNIGGVEDWDALARENEDDEATDDRIKAWLLDTANALGEQFKEFEIKYTGMDKIDPH